MSAKTYCEVCDGEVTSLHFCKNCKKFVRTYTADRTYYINERHGEAKQPHDCEYHDTSTFPNYRDAQPNVPKRPNAQPNVPKQPTAKPNVPRPKQTSQPQRTASTSGSYPGRPSMPTTTSTVPRSTLPRDQKPAGNGRAIVVIMIFIWLAFAGAIMGFLRYQVLDPFKSDNKDRNDQEKTLSASEETEARTLSVDSDTVCEAYDHYSDIYLDDMYKMIISPWTMKFHISTSRDSWENNRPYVNEDGVEETSWCSFRTYGYGYKDSNGNTPYQQILFCGDSNTGQLHYALLSWNDLDEMLDLAATSIIALEPEEFTEDDREYLYEQLEEIFKSLDQDTWDYYTIGGRSYIAFYWTEKEEELRYDVEIGAFSYEDNE